MKNSHVLEDEGFIEIVLLNRYEKQIVLTILQGGAEIKVSYQKETVILNECQLLALYDNTKYKLIIKEETTLLLTIANEIPKLSAN